MTFLLHGKKFSKEIGDQIITFIDQAIEQNISIIYTDSFYQILKKRVSKYNNTNIETISSLDKNPRKIDYLICFGGDGTILHAATIVKNSEIPIVGINTGRLGFLATISKNELLILDFDLILSSLKKRNSNKSFLLFNSSKRNVCI